MDEVFITTPDGKQASYEEKQVFKMWDQGILRSDLFYWKAGMIEWRPIIELVKTPPPHVQPTTPPIPLSYSKSGEVKRKIISRELKLVAPTGVSGWLFLFCFILIITNPFYSLVYIGNIQLILDDLRKFVYPMPMQFFLSWIIILMAALSAYGFIIGLLILIDIPRGRGKKLALQYLKINIIIGILNIVAITIALHALQVKFDYKLDLLFGESIMGIVPFVIWYFYFKKSKRVRATYGP